MYPIFRQTLFVVYTGISVKYQMMNDMIILQVTGAIAARSWKAWKTEEDYSVLIYINI